MNVSLNMGRQGVGARENRGWEAGEKRAGKGGKGQKVGEERAGSRNSKKAGSGPKILLFLRLLRK